MSLGCVCERREILENGRLGKLYSCALPPSGSAPIWLCGLLGPVSSDSSLLLPVCRHSLGRRAYPGARYRHRSIWIHCAYEFSEHPDGNAAEPYITLLNPSSGTVLEAGKGSQGFQHSDPCHLLHSATLDPLILFNFLLITFSICPLITVFYYSAVVCLLRRVSTMRTGTLLLSVTVTQCQTQCRELHRCSVVFVE